MKLFRDKDTGALAGYGFADFSSHQAASEVLQSFHGTEVPGTGVTFRLGWGGGQGAPNGAATGSAATPTISAMDLASLPTVFVGDLGPECTDALLMEAFRVRYPSIVNAKAVMDSANGTCKGYGFCRFTKEEDVERALKEMTGVFVGSRAIRVSRATRKADDGAEEAKVPPLDLTNNGDPNNTTVFVGNVDSLVDLDMLRQHFQPFGTIVSVKLPPGPCGSSSSAFCDVFTK